MLGCRADPSASRQTNYHGHGDLPAEHIAHLRRLIHQLIHAHRQEVTEHQLSDRTQAGGGGANGGTNDGAFRNRGIPYPLLTKLIEHTGTHTETAAKSANIFTEQQYIGVFTHPDTHAFPDGFCITHLFHRVRTSSMISE